MLSEKKVVGRNVAIVLGTICIILTVGLIGTIMSYTSIIGENYNTIVSLNSQISSLQNEIANLQNQVIILQNQVNDITNLCGLGTIKISWFNAWLTPDENKLNITATIVNNGSIPAKNFSLKIDVLFYQMSPQNNTRISTNRTFEIGELNINDFRTINWSVTWPEGEGWHFSVDFTLYVNGVETDHQSFGCY